ncbi:MAG: hypothetical protein K6C13_00720 [Oscillospiraceae bacterium]|nr:hypothetical protein [Oscillospiraceae bacterium]
MYIYIKNNSYVIVNGDLTVGALARIIIFDTSKIIVTGKVTNEGFIDNGLVQTTLQNLVYHASDGTSPAYFTASDGKKYTFDGSTFTEMPGTFTDLQTLIDNAEDGATITLEKDYKAGASESRIYIPENKTITIDLHGHTIDRGLTERVVGARVIFVGGTLTLMDTSEGKTGTITGGFTDRGSGSGSGGGILVGGTFNMYGGTITGNTADGEGGGGVANLGTFIMTGGTISGNNYNDNGNDVPDNVYNTSTGTMYLGSGTDIKNLTNEGTVKTIGTVTAGETANGTVTADSDNTLTVGETTYFIEGTLVTLTATPADGYSLKNFTVNGEAIEGSTFEMPESDVTVGAVFVQYGTFADLQGLINGAENNSTITLDKDYKAGASESQINIPENKTITINLNGHTIDRGLTQETYNGSVIVVNGELTLTDTSEGKTGTIKGGWGDCSDGGGVCVNDSGTFNMYGGNITGNNVTRGDGGGVRNSGSFNMYGGNITGNNVTNGSGGGVFNNGTFNMYGGNITGNNVTDSDSGGVKNSGSFNMYGGNITGNNVTNGWVGGVNNDGIFIMTGGTISGNGNDGVENNDTFIMTGGTISGNTGNNVFLNRGTMYRVSGIVIENLDGYQGTVKTIGTVTAGETTNGTVTADSENKITVGETTYFIGGETVTLTATPADGYSLKNFTVNGSAIEGSTFEMPAGNVTVGAEFEEVQGPVTYIDENGAEQTCTNYTVLDNTMTSLGTEDQTTWYVVKDSIEFDEQTVNLKGDVHIILCDDKTMKFDGIYRSIYGGNLTIYGQSSGTGKLDLICAGQTAIVSGSITINGGIVIADAGENDYHCGIKASGNVIINGGSVSAKGHGYGIKAGKDIILGGAEIKSKSYNATDTVKVKDGMVLTDGTQYYFGTLTDDQISAIANKTLVRAYAVNTSDMTNGTVSASGTNVNNVLYNKKGATVTLTATPADGYSLKNFTVNGEAITGDTFEMPAGNVTVGAEFEEVGTFADLQGLIYRAENNSTITLEKDYKAGANEGAVEIRDNMTITINLNGHTIDRGLTQATGGGSVIFVSGNLTLTDTSEGKTGTIKGGWVDCGDGGGVCVNGSGTFNMYGGNITGNNVTIGSGGGVRNSGSFNMYGGNITGNNVTIGNGGGVDNEGIFIMTGGTITGNTADSDGGGVDNKGTFTMTGGTISGNTDDNVYLYMGTMYRVSGIEIKNLDGYQGTVKTIGTITAGETANGTVTAGSDNTFTAGETTYFIEGETVTLTATPDDGYQLSSLTVMNGVTPVAVENGQFTMPAGNVTVSAVFEEDTSAITGEGTVADPYLIGSAAAFETFMNDADTYTGTNIKLTADISGLTFADIYGSPGFTIGRDCNIDFNGKTINFENERAQISSGKTVTVTDSSAGAGGGFANADFFNYGTLTIDNGRIDNVLLSNKSTLKINGGTFTENSTVYSYGGNAYTEINGGIFNGNVETSYPFSFLNIYGGTFKKDPSAYVQSGYTAVKNSDGTYTVKKNCTVTVRNGKIGENTSASVAPGTEVTVTANNAPEGKTFSYWMDGNGRRVSTDSTYTFTPTADTTVTAVFSTASTVNITGGKVTKKNGTALGTPTDSISVVNGQSVTVTADAPAEGQEFIGWYYVNGNQVLSNSTEYTFTVVSGTNIEARFQNVAGIVTFYSNGIIQGEPFTGGTFTEEDYPADPTPWTGYEFDKWDKTPDQINDELKGGGNVAVNAKFAVKQQEMILTVYNGESETPTQTTYTQSQWISVTADDVANKKFGYWIIDGNENNRNYNKTFTYKITSSMTIKAVYSTEEVEALGTAAITSKSYNSSTNKATFVAYLTVPEGAVISRAGLIATNAGPGLTMENAQYVKVSAPATGTSVPATYTWTKTKVNSGDTWYVRAYVIYTYKYGTEHLIMSDVVSYTATA